MKSTALIAFSLLFAAVANAQTSPAHDSATSAIKDTTAPTASAPAASAPGSVASTSTVTTMTDTSANSAYVSHPERLQGLKTENITPSHVFPALGSYKGSGNSTEDVTITLDETNKGIVWVDGLPEGKFKALMKKSPSTYKIPMQTSASGKAISEGTLYVNPDTYELTIVSGRPYNETDPTSSLTIDAKKKNAWQYTGTKSDAITAATAAPVAPQQ